jgi:hypothetical protein
MNRRGTIAALALLAVGAAGVTPALAAPAKAKPLKGSWSFTDTTPDPTVSVMNTAKSLGPHCDGDVPAAPVDVNAHTLKVKGKGTLTVNGANTGDWAMDVRDAKNKQLASSDGGFPQDKEGIVLAISKPGSYTVIFCNLGGAPTASATYTYKYR